MRKMIIEDDNKEDNGKNILGDTSVNVNRNKSKY